MKRIALLLLLSGFTTAMKAQERLPVVSAEKRVPVQDYPRPVLKAGQATAARGTGTIGGTNWFVPYELYNELNSEAFESSSGFNNVTLTYMWFDSTVKQRYNTGLGTINYISAAQVIDVVSNSNLFDDPSFTGTIDVGPLDSFVVDSVYIGAAYVKQPARPSGIVDTLIVSVGAVGIPWRYSRANNSWIANYVQTGQDTLYGPAPRLVDSVNRAMFPSTGARILWKIPLTDAMRDSVSSTGTTVKRFKFGVPNGGLGVAHGNNVGVTVTFKSGDTWTRNVDSVSKFHHFMPLSGYTADNAAMPYYYYTLGDKNGSSLMFSTDSSFYAPTVAIEGTNSNDFNKEFHDMGVHVVCNACRQVNVKNTAINIASVTAVPNPAANVVSVPVTMKESANVTVSLINTLGQTVKVQELGNVNAGQKATATFNTADLSSGLYIYRVTANGQASGGRFVIMH